MRRLLHSTTNKMGAGSADACGFITLATGFRDVLEAGDLQWRLASFRSECGRCAARSAKRRSDRIDLLGVSHIHKERKNQQ